MKILIIPVKETVYEDFKKISNGLHATGDCKYANFLAKNVSFAEVDEANPYVEIQFPAKGGEMITMKECPFCCLNKKAQIEKKRLHKVINKTIQRIGEAGLKLILEDILKDEMIVLPSVSYLQAKNRALEDENLALMLSKMHLSRSIDEVTEKYKKSAMELCKKTFEKVKNENPNNGNA